jgi:hypothetical protein
MNNIDDFKPKRNAKSIYQLATLRLCVKFIIAVLLYENGRVHFFAFLLSVHFAVPLFFLAGCLL